jgi:hypothetical protein
MANPADGFRAIWGIISRERHMDIPDPLHELIDRLGETLLEAIANDPGSRALARQIQDHGFEVALLVEATIALHAKGQTEDASEEAPAPPTVSLHLAAEGFEPQENPWSEEDRAFLRRFKIRLD